MVGAAEMNPVSTFTMSSYGVRPSPMTVNFVTAGMGGMMGEYQIPIGMIDSSVCVSFLQKKKFLIPNLLITSTHRLDCCPSF